MRVLVMFDLPVVEASQRKEYRKFRNFLIKNGFVMFQQSIYIKLLLNETSYRSVILSIHKNKPSSGSIQVLKITERQFAKMDYIVGKKRTEFLDSDERLIII